MADFLSLLLRISLLGTLLSGLLFLVRLVFRGRISQTVYYYLWIPVLLRLCIPGGIVLSLPAEQETVPYSPPAFVFPAETPGQPAPVGEIEDLPAVPAPAASEKSLSPVEHMKKFLKSPSLWVSVWGLGALAFLGWYIGGYLRFSHKIRKSFLKPSPEASVILRRIKPARRSKCVNLAVSPLVNTPMLLGVFHPVIVLPEGIEDKSLLRDILAHELTHARRFDLLYKWFTAIAASLHWFNPVMVLVRKEINRACELSCDEIVVRRMSNGERRHYGETLLKLAAGTSSGQQRLAVTLCEEKRHLKQRLTAIAQYHKKGALSVLFSVLLVMAAGGCALISDAEQQPSKIVFADYEAYRSALLGKTQIICYTDDGTSSVSISEVPAVFSPDSDYAKIQRFSVVDLNGDGANETVLQVIDAAGDMGGYLVLHWEDGEVFGYPRSYREFESLKTDGTYSFSNFLGTEWGACTASFIGETYIVQKLFNVQLDFGSDTTYSHYLIYGEDRTEVEYVAAADRQAKKPDAVWYEFSGENIEKVFSGNPSLSLLPASLENSNILSDDEALEASKALAEDFMAYWETVKDGMVLPRAYVFCSDRFEGMDLAVFVSYPEYKTSRTLIYSITGSAVKRIGEIPSGFLFEMSSSNGGMLHTNWTLENLSGSGEEFDVYYRISPDEIIQTLNIGAAFSDGTVEMGTLYHLDRDSEELTVEEYDSYIAEASRDFVNAQAVSFNQRTFGTDEEAFDLANEEDGAFADYIFGQMSGIQASDGDFPETPSEPEQELEDEFGPSGNPAAIMDEEQQKYYDTYLRTWGIGSPFREDFSENDDPVADGKLYFIFHSLFYLEHPDDGYELIEQMEMSGELVIPAELFETTFTSHFNTTIQALRRNLRYDGRDFYDEATNTYHFGSGRGGAMGAMSTVSGIHQEGDLLELEYNWFEREYLPGRLFESGVVTIRLLPDGGWKYIANRITYNSARDG